MNIYTEGSPRKKPGIKRNNKSAKFYLRQMFLSASVHNYKFFNVPDIFFYLSLEYLYKQNHNLQEIPFKQKTLY